MLYWFSMYILYCKNCLLMTLKVFSRCPYGDLRVSETAVCGFELLLYSHLPTLHPTTYCLAAGIAGGWHLLPERGWCGRDLWTEHRPVGVWETDAEAHSAAHWVKPCVISFMLSPPLLRGNTTWEVAYLLDGWYVSGTVFCALGTDLWVWKTGAFVLSDVVYWLTPALRPLGILPLYTGHNLAYSGLFP